MTDFHKDKSIVDEVEEMILESTIDCGMELIGMRMYSFCVIGVPK
jgi:hypothetical protein